jgi:hypothetical protein
MLISDVVRPKPDAEFRNDVQLRWYVTGGAENLALVKSYMFTRKSLRQRKSPIDILYRLRQAFLTDNFENRFMVIATYGHGKSHLALALANYFGKGAETDECSALVGSIKHAFGNEAEAQGYQDFKHSRKRMLVVCLEGTRPGDLAQHFLSALQVALKNEPETSSVVLPFWTREAMRIVESIAANQQEHASANVFLKERSTDLAALQAVLNGQDPHVYDIVRDLVHYVRGVRPDLGGPVSLANAVEWAADEFCALDGSKPFGGILILFDEFSAFLRNYSVRRSPGNPLQDLLDGVSNRKGKVVFAAFGQLDPTATIESVFSLNANNAAREAMLVELTRLPAAFHFQLYTTMEDVIDTYLWQNDEVLSQEFENGHAWPAVETATDDCLSIFERHYERDLGWDTDQFQKRVTLGSFPLHPLTTALVCNIELSESTNPRSVLGFVFEELRRRMDLPVVSNQRPTWVDPFTLVDQFGNQLADEEWKQYMETCRSRGGDVSDEEAVVLKGMLLHIVGRMPTSLVSYSKAIGQLTGLSTDRADEVLQSLCRLGVIDNQVAQGKYAFWSVGGGARLLHDHVNNSISGRSLTWDDLEAVHKDGRGFYRPTLPVPISWGHQNDWQAEQFYLTRSFLTPEKITKLIGDARGAVIWLVGTNDDDVKWLDNEAQGILDRAASDPAAPIVFMLPAQPRPSLIVSFQKYRVLRELSAAEINDYGGGVVQSVKGQVASSIKEETQALEATLKRVLVPHLFAAGFNATTNIECIDAIVRKAYELAYTETPPAFFNQYKQSSGQLRTAVKLLGKHLLENRVSKLSEGANSVADGLLKNFLVVGPVTSWGILSLEGRLQEPTSARTRKAWDRLNGGVPADRSETPVRNVIRQLQAPPCGYDLNTLSLLFCAWFGYHRHDLRVTVAGVVTPCSEMLHRLEDSPASLVQFLLGDNVSLQRQDRSQTKAEIRGIVEHVRRMSALQFSHTEANNAIEKLAEFLDDEANEEPSERHEVEEAKSALESAFLHANAYDTEARKLQGEVDSAFDIQSVIRLLNRVTQLQLSEGVSTTELKQDALKQLVMIRLGLVVEKVCKENVVLPDFEHYHPKKDRLESARRALADHLDLQQQVVNALSILEDAKKEIDGQRQDQATIAVLNMMQATGSLSQLVDWLNSSKSLKCHSSMARDLQSRKVNQLEQGIINLRKTASSLSDRLDAIGSVLDVRRETQAIRRIEAFYEGTPEHEIVLSGLKRIESIESVFSSLEEIDSAIELIRKPLDVEKLRVKIQSLLLQHEASLSEFQKVAVGKRSAKIGVRVVSLEKNAVDWLAKLKAESVDTERPTALLHDLLQPPPFLPEESREELEALAAEMRKRVDADISGQIIQLFTEIGNNKEQRRVLDELEKLLRFKQL